jgi:hypothetical protein
MDERSQKRINETGGSQHNACRIYDKRSVEILKNDGATPSRSFNCVDKFPQVISDQKYVGARMSHFRPTPHSDANVRVRKRRGIINAVPDHRNGSARSNQLIHAGRLLLGEQFTRNLLHSDAFSNCLSGSR